MKNILIGYFIDAESTGIDKYLLRVLDILKDKTDYHVHLLAYENSEKLKMNLSKYSVEIHITPRLSHPIKQYQFFTELMKQIPYEVVYINISEPINSLLAIVAHHQKVKRIVVHSHNVTTGTTSTIKKQIMILINDLFRCIVSRVTTDYYACSLNAGKWMFSKKINKEKRVNIIYNPIELDDFRPDADERAKIRSEYGVDNVYVIGHIGNYVYAKNSSFVIDIAAETVKKKQNLIFWLIGDGAERNEIIAKVKRLGLDSNVVFWGRRSDVPALMQAMDIFVLPSIFEGLPISAIEAQASGLKVLLSDTITQEVKILDSCEYLAITDAKIWADHIIEYCEAGINRQTSNGNSFDKFNLQLQENTILKIFEW